MPVEPALPAGAVFSALVGVLLALVATSFQNLGPAMQKEALNLLPQLSTLSLKKQVSCMARSRLWVLGFALAALGVIPYVAAVSVAGVAVAQPVTGCGTVAVLWYARRRLRERLSPRTAFGAGLLMTLPAFVTFSAVSIPTRIVGESIPPWTVFLWLSLPPAAALSLVPFAKRFPLLMVIPVSALYAVFPLCLQMVVGLLQNSGYSSLKQVGAVREGLTRDTALWGSALLLLYGIGASAAGYYLAQIGLQRNPAVRFTPLVNAGIMAAGTVAGILLFGQRVGRPVLYGAGLVLAVTGMLLLAGGLDTDRRRDQKAVSY